MDTMVPLAHQTNIGLILTMLPLLSKTYKLFVNGFIQPLRKQVGYL